MNQVGQQDFLGLVTEDLYYNYSDCVSHPPCMAELLLLSKLMVVTVSHVAHSDVDEGLRPVHHLF